MKFKKNKSSSLTTKEAIEKIIESTKILKSRLKLFQNVDINNLEKIIKHVYYNQFLDSKYNSDNFSIWCEIIFKNKAEDIKENIDEYRLVEWSKIFFTKRKTNKFLNWCKENSVISGFIFTILNSIITTVILKFFKF